MQPLATATSAQFYGTIAVGRQVTAPPQLYDRRMAVGRHRHPKVAVTVKGSRALVKVYTEVNLRVQQANACYGVGLEPVIAMVWSCTVVRVFIQRPKGLLCLCILVTAPNKDQVCWELCAQISSRLALSLELDNTLGVS